MIQYLIKLKRDALSLVIIGSLIALFSSCTSESKLTVSPLFNNNMVLQRDQPIHIWGQANDGANITLEFNRTMFNTIAKDGKWDLTLPQHSAGGPYTIKISSGLEEIKISNVLIGDVWVCSGQSNMEWLLRDSDKNDVQNITREIPDIRHYKVPHSISNTPNMDLPPSKWEIDRDDNHQSFTAVGYYFAQELFSELKVPIGLINSSWGGSRVEPWINPSLRKSKVRSSKQKLAIKFAKSEFDRKADDLNYALPKTINHDAGFVNDSAIWANPDLDLSDWQRIEVPSKWESVGYEGLDGVGWYKTSFELTKEEAKTGITISIGRIDDCDKTFINGVLVGGYCYGIPVREYSVQASVLKEGKNDLTIRVEDVGGDGGLVGHPSQMYIKSNSRMQNINNEWKFKIGTHLNMDFSGMYNQMIHPLTGFPIKGVIWYQGESNAFTENDARNYHGLFEELIANWRDQWGIGDFPFLYVQLANFMEADTVPSDSYWAYLRQSQSRALNLSNTGQAVIIDIGDALDIHPKNKQDVGRRLALAARKIAYDHDIIYSGPTFKSYRLDGNKVIISFDHVGSGLMAKGNGDGVIHEFAVATNHTDFVYARAIIEGDDVVVWNDAVKDPKRLRYAWANNPDNANLYNVEGLPASPFQIVDIK